jgi:hypothetical protein
MGKFVDITGTRFGRWLVLSKSCTSGKNLKWKCICDCGTEREVFGFLLKNGDSTSCGCYNREVVISKQTTHGMTKTRPHNIWTSMKYRCKDTDQPNYGSRGITYCTEWEEFEVFWRDMEDGYEDGLELDRIDVNGDYCKENCRWVDKNTQQYNRRKSPLNTSGRTGVSYYSSRCQWEAYITVKGDFIKLGYFNDFDSAVEARIAAEIKYFGEVKKYA